MKYGKCKVCYRDEYMDVDGKCPVCALSRSRLLRIAEKVVFITELAESIKFQTVECITKG